MIALLLAAPLAVRLPLDLAYSHREIHQLVIGTITSDGRWIAYEIRSPENSGDTRLNALPDGFPTVLFGFNLSLGNIDTGESRALCAKGPCWRGSFSPDNRQLAYYSYEDGAPSVWVYDIAS